MIPLQACALSEQYCLLRCATVSLNKARALDRSLAAGRIEGAVLSACHVGMDLLGHVFAEFNEIKGHTVDPARALGRGRVPPRVTAAASAAQTAPAGSAPPIAATPVVQDPEQVACLVFSPKPLPCTRVPSPALASRLLPTRPDSCAKAH